MADELSPVQSYMNGGQAAKSNLATIVGGIASKEQTLLKLVEDLGPFLTSTEEEKRSHGTQLLADVLQRLTSVTLSDREVELLLEFFCDRLKDHYTVTPHALSGLLHLATNQLLPHGSGATVVKTIFKEVHNQSLLQSSRYTLYSLLAVLLDKSLDGLKEVGNDFVFGFIQAMDGEKDPRNLVLAFQLVKVIARNFPIDLMYGGSAFHNFAAVYRLLYHYFFSNGIVQIKCPVIKIEDSLDLFVEDLFEVTSCYFPIDFTPPPGDPYNVKKDDLVLGLRGCMAATSKFAPFCLPLLQEKLSSSVVSAKVDSLLTLAACAENYKPTDMKDFLEPFWTAIRKEIYQSISTEVEEAGLKAINSIVRNLSGDGQPFEVETFNNIMELILRDCTHSLQDSKEIKFWRPSGRILCKAAASSPACRKISQSFFPLLLKQFNTFSQPLHRKIVLDLLLEFLKVCKDFHSKGEAGPVSEHKDELSSTFFSILVNDSPTMRRAGISGLVAMTTLPDIFSMKEISMFVKHLSNLVLQDTDATVRQESTISLAFLACDYPDDIQSTILPLLLHKLKTEDGTAMEVEADVPQATHVDHKQVLDTLSAVCTHATLVKCVIPELLEHGRNLSVGSDKKEEDNNDPVTKAVAVLKCILSIVEGALSKELVEQEYFSQYLIPNLLELTIKPAVSGFSKELKPVLSNSDVLDGVCAIMRTITRSLDVDHATSILMLVENLLVKCSLSEINVERKDGFAPLDVSSPTQQTQLICLMTSSFCAVRKEVPIPHQSTLLDQLLRMSLHCRHRWSAVAASKCLAGLTNKMIEGEELNSLLKKVDENIAKNIFEKSDEEEKWRATITWIWLTKALALRSHIAAKDFIHKVLGLFTDTDVGRVAADGFYIIMSDTEDVMNQPMHANIRLMYKQRLFMTTVPKLVEGFHAAPSEVKHHYLCALSHLLQWLPKQVLLTELPSLMPLLVQSLTQKEENLQLSTLETLYGLTLDAPEIVTRQVTSLIPQFLGLSKCQTSMKVRCQALKCLGAMTTLPHHVVYPYKNKVTRALADNLDDKKRLVRSEAVKCRTEWFLLGSSAR